MMRGLFEPRVTRNLVSIRAVVNLIKEGFFIVNHLLELVGEFLPWKRCVGVLEPLNDIGRVLVGCHGVSPINDLPILRFTMPLR